MSKIKKLCSVEGCGKKHSAKGFCQAHYVRLKRSGTVGDYRLQIKGTKGCVVPNCSGFHIAHGLCQKHYTIYNNYKLSVEQICMLPTECEICQSKENLQIDHDHDCCSGKKRVCGNCVRRILCRNCNTGIGHLGDEPEKYLKIAKILKENPNPRLFSERGGNNV